LTFSATPAYHLAAHRANFWAIFRRVQLQAAIDFAEAAEGGAELVAWRGMPRVLRYRRICT